MLNPNDETWGHTWPFPPHYCTTPEATLHFVDIGQGEPLVLVHGDPTWGYLYRQIIPPLARQHRCIVPDHMGMGKSSVPAAPYPYRLAHHIANLEHLLIQHLDLSAMTMVLHDWGGPVGLGVATRHPTRIKRLILMNTWAFAAWPGGPFPRLLDIIRSPRGDKFVLDRHGYLAPALLGTTHHPEHLTPTVLAAYHAPFPTPEARRALLCWSRDIPVTAADPSYATMQGIEEGLRQFRTAPVLLIWGMRDPVLGPLVLRLWQQHFPQAVTYPIVEASHFVQEDAPDDIVQAITQFLLASP